MLRRRTTGTGDTQRRVPTMRRGIIRLRVRTRHRARILPRRGLTQLRIVPEEAVRTTAVLAAEAATMEAEVVAVDRTAEVAADTVVAEAVTTKTI